MENLTRTASGMRRFPIVPALPLVILAVVVVVAVFAPQIAPHGPTGGSLRDARLPPFWMEGSNPRFILGTDDLGGDTLSRLIYGTRVSLLVSLFAIFFSGAIGTILGLVSGYYRGWIDAVVMRLTDIGLSIPLILMAVMLAAVQGPSFANVILVISILLWPRYARQVRGETLSVREQDFVALARVHGCSSRRIIIKHIFPSIVPTLLVLATLQVGYVILLESSLSFLGVGVPPPTPSWGSMVADGRMYIGSSWWISTIPGAAIMLTVLSMNQLGDWLRDRLDPKLRQV